MAPGTPRTAPEAPGPGGRSRPLRRPAPSIRLRLTALYGGVFLVSSAILLTVGYLFARSHLLTHPSLHRALVRLGFDPRRGAPFGLLTTSEVQLIHSAENSIVGGALHRLLLEYVVALFVMTAVSAVAGWLLAGRALAPLRKITATARRVSGENLGERIALQGPADELRELADTFDGMLVRLDSAFASQRHFVANASHELRTPLAIMRTEVDVALADPDADVTELREMGEAVLDSIERCERLISSLLLLARSEAAPARGELVDLAALAGDCITDLWQRAREADVEIRDDLAAAWTIGDPGLLERLIANLVDNGIHHNVSGGWLLLSTRERDGLVELTVANGGPPLDSERVGELMEPFRRRDRSSPGFGLGLSIVRSIAVAHRGSATLSAPAQGGLEVRIALPRGRLAGHPAAPGSTGGVARRGTPASGAALHGEA